jgi:hypothetical protein
MRLHGRSFRFRMLGYARLTDIDAELEHRKSTLGGAAHTRRAYLGT